MNNLNRLANYWAHPTMKSGFEDQGVILALFSLGGFKMNC